MEMASRILFRSPDGRRKGLFTSSLSLITLLGWVYFGIVHDGPHILLFLGVALGFSGFAETLPQNRPRLAGVFRILGLGILLIAIILLAVVPEFILK